jgi:hypothetical protein
VSILFERQTGRLFSIQSGSDGLRLGGNRFPGSPWETWLRRHL